MSDSEPRAPAGQASIEERPLPNVEGAEWAGTKLRYNLLFPFEYHGQSVNYIEFRRMSGKEFRMVNLGEAMSGDVALNLAGALIGDSALVDKMDAADAMQVAGIIDFLLSRRPSRGGGQTQS